MSLKSFIGQKEVSSKLKEVISKPKQEYNKDILVKPKSKNYNIVGIAFDYLMRMHIYRINFNLVDSFEFFAEASLVESILGKENYKLGEKILKNAKENLEKYIKFGVLKDDLLISCLQLAQIDLVRRAMYVSDNFGDYKIEDIEDLKAMYTLMINHDWKCNQNCRLNPNFGLTSLLVGGADADLILDDMLIDIKAISAPEVSRQHFNQLLGYYILSRIEGEYDIKRIGIYSARYSNLIVYSISDLIDEKTMENLIEWFGKKAYEQYGALYELGKSKLDLLSS